MGHCPALSLHAHVPKMPLPPRSQQAEMRPEDATTSANKAKKLNKEQHCYSVQAVYPLLPPRDWKLQRWVAELTSTTSSPPGHFSCQNNSLNHFPHCITTSASLGRTCSQENALVASGREEPWEGGHQQDFVQVYQVFSTQCHGVLQTSMKTSTPWWLGRDGRETSNTSAVGSVRSLGRATLCPESISRAGFGGCCYSLQDLQKSWLMVSELILVAIGVMWGGRTLGRLGLVFQSCCSPLCGKCSAPPAPC